MVRIKIDGCLLLGRFGSSSRAAEVGLLVGLIKLCRLLSDPFWFLSCDGKWEAKPYQVVLIGCMGNKQQRFL